MADEPNAGRDLDERIAREVMGDYRFETARIISGRVYWWKHDGEIFMEPLPYSTDIRRAWEVVERLDLFASRLSASLDVGLTLQRDVGGAWEIRYRFGSAIARGESVELAICRAALLLANLAPTPPTSTVFSHPFGTETPTNG